MVPTDRVVNRIFVLILSASVATMLTGCGAPRLETSSEDALEKSLREMREHVSTDDRVEFEQALTQHSTAPSGREYKLEDLAVLHAMTAEEIIAFTHATRPESLPAGSARAGARKLVELGNL